MSPRPLEQKMSANRVRASAFNMHRPCAHRPPNKLNANTECRIHIYPASRSYSNTEFRNAIHTRNEPREEHTTNTPNKTTRTETEKRNSAAADPSLSESETDRRGGASRMVRRARCARQRWPERRIIFEYFFGICIRQS